MKPIKLLLLFFLLTFTSKTFCNNNNSDNRNLKNQIISTFNHANTFYWYGRYKNNTLLEFKKSRYYLNKTDSLLHYSNVLDRDTSFVIFYDNAINTFRKVLNYIDTICIDNLNGRFPLYNIFAGQIEDFECWDSADELAVESSLKSLLVQKFKEGAEIGKRMFFSIVVVNPFDNNMEEIAQEYLNINSSHYIISRHELSEILNKPDFKKLKSGKTDTIILKRIADFFNINKLGVFTITKNDYVDNVYYYGTRFTKWHFEKNVSTDNLYTEGFKNDKKSINSKAKSIFIVFFLIITILFYIIFFVFFRNNSLLLTATLIYLLSTAASVLILKGINHLTISLFPSPVLFYDTPKAFLWRILFSLITGTGNIIIIYVLLGRFYKKALLQMPYVFAFTLPALTSFALVQSYYSVIVLGFSKNIFYTNLIYILSLIFFSVFISRSIYMLLMEKEVKKNLSALILFFFIIVFQIFYIIKYFTLLHTLQVTGVSFAVFVCGVIAQYFPFTNLKKKEITSKETKYAFSESDFLRFLQNPIFVKGDKFDKQLYKIKSAYKSNKSLQLITIKGKKKTGKSRFAKELVSALSKDNGNKYRGSCDEDIGGTTITYQVLLEVFGEAIGKGKFKDPGRGADIIIKVAEYTPFLNYFGALSKVKVKNQQLLSHEEVADTIYNILLETNKPAFITIENIQWIDIESAKVLHYLFAKFIRRNKNKKNILLIFTETTDYSTSKTNEGYNFFKENLNIYNNSFDTFTKYDIEENEFVEDNFAKLFFDSLTQNTPFKFSYNSKRRILSFFGKLNIYTAANVVDFFKYTCDNKLLKFSDGEIALKKDVDLLNVFEKIKSFKNVINIDELDPELKKILETAAFIGETFDAVIIEKIWGIKHLELLHMLDQAEKIGLVFDKNEYDNIYQFASDEILEQFRQLSMSKFENKQRVTQIVKEYNTKIIEIIEDINKNNIDSYDNDIVFSLAKRSYKFGISDKKKIVKYNEEAGDRCMRIGRFDDAKTYYQNAIDIQGNKSYVNFNFTAEEKLTLKIKLAKAYINSGKHVEENVLNEKEAEKVSDNNIKADFYLTKALWTHRKRHANDKEGLFKIKSLISKIPDKIEPEKKFRKEFYFLHFVKYFEFKEDKKGKDKVISELEELSKVIEKKKDEIVEKKDKLKDLLLEIYNGLAINTKDEKKLYYTDMALEELNNDKKPVDSDIKIRKELIESLMKYQDDLSQDNVLSFSFLLYNYSCYYLTKGKNDNDYETALYFINKAILLNERIGNSKGIIMSYYLLAILQLNKDKESAVNNFMVSFDESMFINDEETQVDIIKELYNNKLLNFLNTSQKKQIKNRVLYFINNDKISNLFDKGKETLSEILSLFG